MKKVVIIATFLFSLNISYAGASMLGRYYSIENSEKDSLITFTFSIANLGCGADAAAMQKAIAF